MRAILAVLTTGWALLFAKGALADLPPSLADAIEVDEGLCFDREMLAVRIQHWEKIRSTRASTCT